MESLKEITVLIMYLMIVTSVWVITGIHLLMQEIGIISEIYIPQSVLSMIYFSQIYNFYIIQLILSSNKTINGTVL